MKLHEYANGGYENNPPDYSFEGLDFISTCGACPEQYDVIYSVNDKKYQVGYIRLRWGKLSCAFPDVGGKIIYEKYFDDASQGCFDSEEQRQQQLHLIALEIVDELIPVVIMMNKHSRLKSEG